MQELMWPIFTGVSLVVLVLVWIKYVTTERQYRIAFLLLDLGDEIVDWAIDEFGESDIMKFFDKIIEEMKKRFEKDHPEAKFDEVQARRIVRQRISNAVILKKALLDDILDSVETNKMKIAELEMTEREWRIQEAGKEEEVVVVQPVVEGEG